MDTLVVHDYPSADPHHARSAYVETYWLPTLGPTCLMILRQFALRFDAAERLAGSPADDQRVRWFESDLSELAHSIGLRGSMGGPSKLRGSLDRMERFGLALKLVPGGGHWAVRSRLPWLRPRQVDFLPAELRRSHAAEQGAASRLAVPA